MTYIEKCIHDQVLSHGIDRFRVYRSAELGEPLDLEQINALPLPTTLHIVSNRLPRKEFTFHITGASDAYSVPATVPLPNATSQE
jgi:hypothetical protein